MERAKKPHLPYARHGVDDSDRRAVLSLFAETELGVTPRLAQGTRVTDFESSVKTFTGAKHAIACASGTAGLHAAMQAIELTKDDVVITQAISFCATANAIRHCGATPLFADIDADKVGLCPRATRRMLEWARRENKRVKAIMPVAMGGVAHASAELYALSREFGCYLIEDAAHALGQATMMQATMMQATMMQATMMQATMMQTTVIVERSAVELTRTSRFSRPTRSSR